MARFLLGLMRPEEAAADRDGEQEQPRKRTFSRNFPKRLKQPVLGGTVCVEGDTSGTSGHRVVIKIDPRKDSQFRGIARGRHVPGRASEDELHWRAHTL